MKVFYKSKICKHCFKEFVEAFTIGSWVFTEHSKESIPDWILTHEEVHVKQYKKHGIVKFLWQYLWVERKTPYKERTFEIEAYKVSSPPK